MKKEIILVLDSFGRGGSDRRVANVFADELIKRGWKVYILITLGESSRTFELNPKIDVIDISRPLKFSHTHRWQICGLAYRTIKILKCIQPDIIAPFLPFSTAVSALASLFVPNVKLITSEMSTPHRDLRNFVMKFIHAHSDACVMQTEKAKKLFPKKVQDNSVVINNPVPVKIYASAERKPRIVSAGHLFEVKNHEMLINSFYDVHKIHPEYRLDIYGEGPLREKLQAQIISLGLENSVCLCGNVPDVHERMADAEIFVLCSNYEGMSNALIEAMVMGLTCISTHTLGSEEIITDGKNGLIVPIGNREKLTEALLKLIENKKLARQFGEEARKVAGKFSVKKVVDQWEELFSKVVNGEKIS